MADMKTKHTQVCAKIKRWRTRLKRAVTAVDKLERQRERLERRMGEPPAPANPAPRKQPAATEPAPAPEAEAQPAPAGEIDTGIPTFLQRDSKRLAALPDPRTREKKAERRVVEKQKLERELTGKTRKMPLAGKDALAAIRGK